VNPNILYPSTQATTNMLTPASISEKDRYLLQKLNEALERDLVDKPSIQRVAICSKVWSEIVRREDPVIASLLTKIKSNYETHIKTLSKQLSQLGVTSSGTLTAEEQRAKQEASAKELEEERQKRAKAEEKVERLRAEKEEAELKARK